jgi:hypothetical protein
MKVNAMLMAPACCHHGFHIHGIRLELLAQSRFGCHRADQHRGSQQPVTCLLSCGEALALDWAFQRVPSRAVPTSSTQRPVMCFPWKTMESRSLSVRPRKKSDGLLIIAQELPEGMNVVSRDKTLDAHGVSRIW